MATYWATVSEATVSAYVTDVGVSHVVEMSVADAGVVVAYDLEPNGDPGLVDLEAAGGFVYALSPGTGSMPAAVTVLDVSGGKGRARLVQHFEVGAMGVGRNAQGMVVMMWFSWDEGIFSCQAVGIPRWLKGNFVWKFDTLHRVSDWKRGRSNSLNFLPWISWLLLPVLATRHSACLLAPWPGV